MGVGRTLEIYLAVSESLGSCLGCLEGLWAMAELPPGFGVGSFMKMLTVQKTCR